MTVNGTASLTGAAPTANTTMIFVVDRSGSTTGNVPGCGGDVNGDHKSNTVLDCELSAALTVIHQAAAPGSSVDEVGAISFSDNATTLASGLTAPSSTALTSAISGVQGGGGTNFAAPAQAACAMAQHATNPNVTVVFMSDGFGNEGGDALAKVPCSPKAATFQTFAVGSGSSCTSNAGNVGSLAQIAAKTGGTCKNVSTVSQLPALVGSLFTPKLTGSPGPSAEVLRLR